MKGECPLSAGQSAHPLTVRLVGRAKLPSNTIGLLVHAAEHTARHLGQLMTTAKVVRAEDPGPPGFANSRISL